MGFAVLFSRVLTIGVFIALGFSAPAFAQQQIDVSTPAHISYVEGGVSVEREGVAEQAGIGVPFLAGDRLVSSMGRAEILFPDGSALHIDERSSVELLSPTLVRLTSGRVLLLVAGANDPANAWTYQVDTPAASVVTDGPGDYRIAILPGGITPDTELAVIRGWATFATDDQSVDVQAGERTMARAGGMPLPPRAFNSARFDAFDTWSLVRRSEHVSNGPSAEYLPRDLRMYGNSFDQYGSWEYENPYGYVWYPAVSPDWRPYYHGYWSSVPSHGWTWVGLDVWAWPTHHYGRWGYERSRWYWIPGRTWSAAWVNWGTTPGFVTWCPLGFDNRPVFNIAVSTGPGWITVPRQSFGKRGFFVHQQFVNHRWSGLDGRTVLHNAAPASPHRVVRTQAPARRIEIPAAVPRHVAVPRRVETSPAAALQSPVPQRGRAVARPAEGASQPSATQPPAESPSPRDRQVWQPRAIPRRGGEASSQQSPAPAATPPAVERSAPPQSAPAPSGDARAPRARAVPRASAPAAREPAAVRSQPSAQSGPSAPAAEPSGAGRRAEARGETRGAAGGRAVRR